MCITIDIYKYQRYKIQDINTSEKSTKQYASFEAMNVKFFAFAIQPAIF